MAQVVGVRFREVGKVYYFDPVDDKFEKGDYVIVETVRGIECGEIALENSEVDDSQIVKPLKKVVRRATQEDLKVVSENRVKEQQAFDICLKKIEDHGLDMMKLVSVEYAFDGSLKTVTLPKSLTYVDRSGFIFGNLEKVVYNGTEEEFEQIESYDDEIRFIQCPIEYADGTIGGTDISQNSGSSDGEKSGTVLFVAITVIVILVLVSASAFFIARRNKQAKQK